ncbi:L-threonylcarbamoyladenylate synthase [Timonella senegalensis]|uniref:L-threonylcarbamoyladenylate synthase n=1 Tax=Timonella senegalensis TaxID=1465825 RepID=UPI0002EEC86B|nr:L-threonylcarbamoyladenylate synthase [Timonella senegalensis]
MAKFFDLHPTDPQPRLISQIVDALREGAVIAYPTDSGYALGTQIGNHDGAERIRSIRQLDDKHHFTLVCSDFAQLGQLVVLDNSAFRAIKASTPGKYTFILPATKEVPRRLAHPKKKTVGVRIPDHPVVQAILKELGEPLLSTSLIIPGHEEPLNEGWRIKDELDHLLDIVIEGGDTEPEPTSVIDYTDGSPEVTRHGSGDTTRFE